MHKSNRDRCRLMKLTHFDVLLRLANKWKLEDKELGIYFPRYTWITDFIMQAIHERYHYSGWHRLRIKQSITNQAYKKAIELVHKRDKQLRFDIINLRSKWLADLQGWKSNNRQLNLFRSM